MGNLARLLYLFFAVFLLGCTQVEKDQLYQQALDESSISVAKKYLLLAKTKDKKATAHELLGYLYKQTKNYDTAIYHIVQSIKCFKKIGNKKRQAYGYQILGNCFKENNAFDLAIANYKHAIELMDKKDYRMKVNIWKAKCYALTKRRAEAFQLLRASLEYYDSKILKKDSDHYLIGECNLILGNIMIYEAQEEGDYEFYEKAITRYVMSASAFYGLKDDTTKTFEVGNFSHHTFIMIAQAYIGQSRYTKARRYLDSAYTLTKHPHEFASIYHTLGVLALKQDSLKRSIYYHEKSIGYTSSWSNEAQKSYLALTNLYIESGDVQKSIEVNNEFHKRNKEWHERNKKIIQSGKEEQFGHLVSRYEIQEKKGEERKSKIINWLFAIALLAIAFIAGSKVVLDFRKKIKNQRLAKAANHKINQAYQGKPQNQ